MKKITRKQAEKLIKEQYGDITSGDWTAQLCVYSPEELKNDFQ